jgi:hypothetical protein
MSGPSSKPADPHGVWTVVAGVNGDRVLMLAKDQTLIQIPCDDVLHVANYDISATMNQIRRIRTLSDLKAYRLAGSKENQGGEKQETR